MAIAQLIEHLESEPLGNLIEQLLSSIGSDKTNGPCVYFVANYESIKAIEKSGFLLPRNAIKEITRSGDLSSGGIQARRHQIFLGNGIRKFKPRQVHDCLNLFFNPFNSTTFAFARNELILGDTPMKLGVIEFPLLRIAEHLNAYGGAWACSKKNIAAGGYHSGILDDLTENWPWEDILDSSEETHTQQPRAAEFIVWFGGGDGLSSTGLPIELASRILIAPDSPLDALEGHPHPTYLKCPAPASLLDTFRYITNFIKYSPNAFLAELENFDSAVSKLSFLPTIDKFLNSDLALSNLHGIPHVTRVMFWTHYLSCEQMLDLISPQNSTDPFLARDSLLAAALHDLRRVNDSEDREHGEAAALHYSDLIEQHCEGNAVRVQRIKNALIYHCKPDEECPNRLDAVFMILKDADALDRGRFSMPCDGKDFRGLNCSNSYCHHTGCAHATLRLNYENVGSNSADWPFRKNLALAAGNVAKVTGTAPWDLNNPASFLVKWVVRGCLTYMKL